MPMLVAGLLLLWLSSILLKGFVRANPTALSRHLRRGGGWLALVFAVAMMVRGEFNVAFGAACFGVWLLGTQPGWMKNQFAGASWAPGRGGWGARSSVSRVRTATVEMALDQATGQMTGRIVAGPAAGAALDSLSQADCVHFHRWCEGADPQGARLLETYLDRRFSGWREAHDAGSDPGGAQARADRMRPAQMADREAYQILGLAEGASREDITRAHRTMMKRYHPDHGGTTDMAARVNEAKAVLMRRHH